MNIGRNATGSAAAAVPPPCRARGQVGRRREGVSGHNRHNRRMGALPTVTVPMREALLYAQRRAAEQGRTQQIELGDNLFIRIAPGGRKFLLFCLEGEPEHDQAAAIAGALGLRDPQFGWHQGETLRSLTVIEPESATLTP